MNKFLTCNISYNCNYCFPFSVMLVVTLEKFDLQIEIYKLKFLFLITNSERRRYLNWGIVSRAYVTYSLNILAENSAPYPAHYNISENPFWSRFPLPFWHIYRTIFHRVFFLSSPSDCRPHLRILSYDLLNSDIVHLPLYDVINNTTRYVYHRKIGHLPAVIYRQLDKAPGLG